MGNDKINNLAKKMKSLAGIQEGDKKFLNNEHYQEHANKKIIKESMGDITPKEWEEIHPDRSKAEKSKSDVELKDDFIIMEFDQTEVEPGQDDEILYKLG